MKLTLSGITRALKCPPSLWLQWTRIENEYATAGQVMDDYLKSIPSMGRDMALAGVPEEHRAAMEKIDLEPLAPFLKPGGFVRDFAMAYDPIEDTSRELARGIPRDQAYLGLKAHEVGGVADLLALADGAVLVPDYKRSWQDRGPLDRHDQLKSYAAVAAQILGVDRALIIRIRILGADPQISTLWLDALDLAKARVVIQDVAAAERNRPPDAGMAVVVGDHCSFCPAMPACPAHSQLVARALDGERRLPDLDRSTLPQYLRVVSRLRALADYIEGRCEKLGRESPVEVEGGQLYGEFLAERDVIDGEKAKHVLQHDYPELWQFAVKARVTKDSIEDLARELKRTQGGKQKQLKADLLQLLRSAGAIYTDRKPKVGFYDPKQLEAGEA